MGLLIAFTFSGAAGRFDDRRHLVTQEANAIGTAWLRIDLVPAEAQAKLRDLFRRYLDSRLETYRKARQMELAMAEFARSGTLQQDIWTVAVAGCRDPGAAPGACVLVLNAMNEMIDITTTQAHGDAHAPAARDLRHARRPHPGRRPAGRPRHGQPTRRGAGCTRWPWPP